ncbi:MAG: NAD(P)H-hydrate dehydratase [Rubrivivax sp.]|nr:NAD(P)H-hydrate dehydratase [Rubrivivax sp.]
MSSPAGITRIVPADGPWPLHDAAASRAAEAAALAAHAPHVLMERAGLAVARLALASAPHAARVQVWAGPGNKGGDGLVAARHLHLAGRGVNVCLLGDPARLPADAARALERAVAAGVSVHVDGTGHGDADLAIDALLGVGAHRAPEGAIAAAIEALNSLPVPVLAVDLPSGLHPDTGALLGHAAVRAAATLALLTLKPGCWTGHGPEQAGELWLDTLGVDAGAPTAWLSGRPARLPRRPTAHKGSFGDVTVIGGAPGMVGAAWLAARAALAAGAGRIYCSLLDDGATAFDPTQPELMSRAAWWQSPPAVLAQTTVICGCGGGDAVRATLPALLTHAARLVLDADALNALATDPALQPLLRARTTRGLPTLLTPHPLEAARLLRTSSAAVQHDRLAAARQLASDTGAAVLLKGSGSVVTAPGDLPRINPTGNAALATAGTGDVLAGWAAGLWAQQPAAAAAKVAAAAAWQHGRAADLYTAAGGTGPLRAGALIEALVRLPVA